MLALSLWCHRFSRALCSLGCSSPLRLTQLPPTGFGARVADRARQAPSAGAAAAGGPGPAAAGDPRLAVGGAVGSQCRERRLRRISVPGAGRPESTTLRALGVPSWTPVCRLRPSHATNRGSSTSSRTSTTSRPPITRAMCHHGARSHGITARPATPTSRAVQPPDPQFPVPNSHCLVNGKTGRTTARKNTTPIRDRSSRGLQP